MKLSINLQAISLERTIKLSKEFVQLVIFIETIHSQKSNWPEEGDSFRVKRNIYRSAMMAAAIFTILNQTQYRTQSL